MIKKILLIIVIFLGTITFAQSENTWIKKKDKDEKVEKLTDKKTSTWIKKKIKENKKKYKKEEKKITKEVKSWIKKKSKDKYIANIKDLPDGAIYFQANNGSRSSLIYGFVLPDINSKLINGYYETNKGFAYLNDGETTCKVASTVKFADANMLMSQISGECTNGIKFTGQTSQSGNSGSGSVNTADGKERYFVDVHSQKEEIAKLYEKNKIYEDFAEINETSRPAPLNPFGKYYALLIGNSDYHTKGKYADLVSPKNDVIKLSKILKSKYKFEKVITGIDVTRDEFFDKIDELKDLVTDNDYVLIYYSGHGEKVENERYWIPVNGSKNNKRNWFNIDDLTSSFEGDISPEIPSTHLALLVDSCWFAVKGSDKINNKNLTYEKLLKKRAAIVMASGNDEFVDEPGKGNSNFAKIIIRELENADSPIRLHNIYMRVSDELGGKQTPFYRPMNKWNHGNGDFIFIPKS